MLVDNVQYDVKLAQFVDESSFCSDLYVPTTFLVGQWSFDRQYDVKRPLTLVYDGGADPIMVSLPGAETVPSTFVPYAGVWWDPSQSGTGYGIGYQDGLLIVQVYSYLENGAAQWYMASGPMNGNVFQGTLDKYQGGQCLSCAATYRPTLVGNDGLITVTFTSPVTANVSLPGGRTTRIQPYFIQ
jgi:hypothetical protein